MSKLHDGADLRLKNDYRAIMMFTDSFILYVRVLDEGCQCFRPEYQNMILPRSFATVGRSRPDFEVPSDGKLVIVRGHTWLLSR